MNTIRLVGIYRGRGRFSALVGKVLLDVFHPDCLNWGKMLQEGFRAMVIDPNPKCPE